MFDIGPTELLLIVVVAVIVIGPKDLPLALRTAGRWIGKMRRVSGHFRSGLETMIREAEMQEMEERWREQNEKIMREHPADAPPEAEPTGAYPAPASAPAPATTSEPAVEPTSAEARTSDLAPEKPVEAPAQPPSA